MTAEQAEGPADEVLFVRRGRLGVITLNRPKAVNALNAGMVAAMTEQLAAWEHDDGVATVLVEGAGERGLCAGGDIVATPVTGAYGHSMASNYNKVPRPPVLFVRDGTARVVVRRETYDDLLRLDT